MLETPGRRAQNSADELVYVVYVKSLYLTYAQIAE
jgi:hypothetical protein